MRAQGARKNGQVLPKITRRPRDKDHTGTLATDVIIQSEISQGDKRRVLKSRGIARQTPPCQQP